MTKPADEELSPANRDFVRGTAEHGTVNTADRVIGFDPNHDPVDQAFINGYETWRTIRWPVSAGFETLILSADRHQRTIFIVDASGTLRVLDQLPDLSNAQKIAVLLNYMNSTMQMREKQNEGMRADHDRLHRHATQLEEQLVAIKHPLHSAGVPPVKMDAGQAPQPLASPASGTVDSAMKPWKPLELRRDPNFIVPESKIGKS